MRTVRFNDIVETVERLCIEANCRLNDDLVEALKNAMKKEESPTGRETLRLLLENLEIARNDCIPVCQDTGMAVIFVDIGQDVRVEGGLLEDALNEGVSRGYKNGFLRKSVVGDPFTRTNTGDNTPAIIHYNIVAGDKLEIVVAPKGFGSENMSALKMLKPSDGIEGVKDFVLETVNKAGPNPCPPIIVGVGAGGTMEKAAILAKKALLRPVGVHHSDASIREMEIELLDRINQLGIGPAGLGGRITALAVNIEVFPTHIAGLPVAVNINCHVSRHAEAVL